MKHLMGMKFSRGATVYLGVLTFFPSKIFGM